MGTEVGILVEGVVVGEFVAPMKLGLNVGKADGCALGLTDGNAVGEVGNRLGPKILENK